MAVTLRDELSTLPSHAPTPITHVAVATASGIAVLPRTDRGVVTSALAGQDVRHVAWDARTGTLWAATNRPGPAVLASDDLGVTWRETAPLPTCEKVWVVRPGLDSEPGTLYAGVEPAAIFRSRDGGATWEDVPGLNRHESRGEWWPGGGGMMLHGIHLTPELPRRIVVTISVAGVLRSDDHGETWVARNEGMPGGGEMWAEFTGAERARYPEVHRCVHSLVTDPRQPERMLAQDHDGVWRTDDGGLSWRCVTEDQPWGFGFAIALGGPADAPIVYAAPVDEDCERFHAKDGLVIWRSFDFGETWEPTRAGLPTDPVNVLRQAMIAEPNGLGVWVGTTNGRLFESRDAGATWQQIGTDLGRISNIAPIRA